MKIGFLTERMVLGFGVDLVVHEAAHRLSAMGHQVVVFTAYNSDLYENASYKLIDLRAAIGPVGNIFSATFMTKCIEYLSQYGIDAWIAETPPFYSWLHHLRSPVILVEHGTPSGKYFSLIRGWRLDLIIKPRHEKIFSTLRPADALVAISEFIKSELPQHVQQKTNVVYNGGDHYPLAKKEDILNFRNSHGLSPGKLTILWVGRIEPVGDHQPYKGLQEFLELSKMLLQKYADLQIVAVGRAEESARPYLEDIGIIPAFNLPAEQMPAAFAAADIFLSTSKWEGFNLPLVEAQTQGVPVIAYNIGAHPEVVSNGESGLLVDSADALASAICKMIDNREFRLNLAAGAQKQAALFTWDKNAELMHKIILQCVATRQKMNQHVPYSAKINKTPGYQVRMIIERMLDILTGKRA